MQKDTTKKTGENAETAKNVADIVEELPRQPVSDRDAGTVKGGGNVRKTPTPPEI